MAAWGEQQKRVFHTSVLRFSSLRTAGGEKRVSVVSSPSHTL